MTKLETILAAIVTLLVLIAPVGCTAYESKLIADMVAGGKDPLEAMCAISSNNPNCAVVAARNK